MPVRPQNSDNLPMIPTTMSERLTCVETYLRNTEPTFPNSVMCYDVGLLLKGMEVESENRSPVVKELVEEIMGSVHALFATIDTNGPNEVRNNHRNAALRQLAALRVYMFQNNLS